METRARYALIGLFILAVIALVVAACGDADGGSDTTAAGDTTTSAAGETKANTTSAGASMSAVTSR